MGRLTKAQLGDKARYQLRKEEVELPELGGSVEVTALTVAERDVLLAASLGDTEPGTKEHMKRKARAFAAMVSDPKLTPEEAEAFLADLPSSAWDRIDEKSAELLSGRSEEEAAEVAKEFRGSDD